VANLDILEAAIDRGRGLRLRYRGVRDTASRWRRVDPLRIRVVEGHVYLIGFDLEASAIRTFKLARVSVVQTLQERVDSGTALRRSVDEGFCLRRAAPARHSPPGGGHQPSVSRKRSDV
jgi:predicted DNA-binding transcriptional regulator YafY